MPAAANSLARLSATCSHITASAAPVSAAHQLVDTGASALAAGKAPQRVPIGDREAVAAALKADGVVILTELPGDQGAPGYWERAAGALPAQTFGGELIAGDPPVAAVHHEFARSAQVRQLQAKRGAVGGVLNRGSAEKMLAEAEAAGMPHFTTVPWKSMGNAHPHTDGYVYGDHFPDYIFLCPGPPGAV